MPRGGKREGAGRRKLTSYEVYKLLVEAIARKSYVYSTAYTSSYAQRRERHRADMAVYKLRKLYEERLEEEGDDE